MKTYPKITVSNKAIIEYSDRISYCLLGYVTRVGSHWLVSDTNHDPLVILHKLWEVREWVKREMNIK